MPSLARGSAARGGDQRHAARHEPGIDERRPPVNLLGPSRWQPGLTAVDPFLFAPATAGLAAFFWNLPGTHPR
jgi:hypothetical protein